MPIDVKLAEKRLEALRSELRRLEEISEEARNTVELDQQSVGRLSRMDALQGQAMAQEQQRRRQMDLVRIDAAMRRLADDEYGYCVECGDEIAERRLEIDPMASHCVNCASLNERG
ncbi:MAG: TraR/DksA C4-type zinc finger protein [Pseudomonadota bacterium]